MGKKDNAPATIAAPTSAPDASPGWQPRGLPEPPKRSRRLVDVPGSHRKEWQIYLKPAAGVQCPAGPGQPPVPAEGRWYPKTTFLLKRVRDGSAVFAVPLKE